MQRGDVAEIILIHRSKGSIEKGWWGTGAGGLSITSRTVTEPHPTQPLSRSLHKS